MCVNVFAQMIVVNMSLSFATAVDVRIHIWAVVFASSLVSLKYTNLYVHNIWIYDNSLCSVRPSEIMVTF